MDSTADNAWLMHGNMDYRDQYVFRDGEVVIDTPQQGDIPCLTGEAKSSAAVVVLDSVEPEQYLLRVPVLHGMSACHVAVNPASDKTHRVRFPVPLKHRQDTLREVDDREIFGSHVRNRDIMYLDGKDVYKVSLNLETSLTRHRVVSYDAKLLDCSFSDAVLESLGRSYLLYVNRDVKDERFQRADFGIAYTGASYVMKAFVGCCPSPGKDAHAEYFIHSLQYRYSNVPIPRPKSVLECCLEAADDQGGVTLEKLRFFAPAFDVHHYYLVAHDGGYALRRGVPNGAIQVRCSRLLPLLRYLTENQADPFIFTPLPAAVLPRIVCSSTTIDGRPSQMPGICTRVRFSRDGHVAPDFSTKMSRIMSLMGMKGFDLHYYVDAPCPTLQQFLLLDQDMQALPDMSHPDFTTGMEDAMVYGDDYSYVTYEIDTASDSDDCEVIC